MGFDKKSLDEEMQEIETMHNRVSELSGEREVPFSELFDQSFMATHSKYANIGDFFDAGGFDINSPDDLEAIPDDEFDQHVNANTHFNSWKEMLQTATSEYHKKKFSL